MAQSATQLFLGRVFHVDTQSGCVARGKGGYDHLVSLLFNDLIFQRCTLVRCDWSTAMLDSTPVLAKMFLEGLNLVTS